MDSVRIMATHVVMVNTLIACGDYSQVQPIPVLGLSRRRRRAGMFSPYLTNFPAGFARRGFLWVRQ